MNRKNGKNISKTSNSNLNINIKSGLYEENYGYDVSSSYRNNNLTDDNNNKLKDSYIDQMQLKIEEQEKTIYELKNYIYLCEKRIKQLNPNEILPITSNSLKKYNNNNNINEENINKKYELLNDKFERLLNDYNEIISNNNAHDTSSNTINLGNNSDKYKLMKEKYKKVKEENKKIIELLKEETKNMKSKKILLMYFNKQ